MASMRLYSARIAFVSLLAVCVLVYAQDEHFYELPLLALPNQRFSDITSLLTPLKPHIHSLLQLVQHVDERVVNALNSESSDLPTCNHRDDHRWKYLLEPYFRRRGITTHINYACVSDVDATSISSSESRRVFKLVTDYSAALSRLSPSIAQSIIPLLKPQMPRSWSDWSDWSDWTNATRPSSIRSIVRTQQCTNDFAFFVMVNRKWYLSTRITNDNPLITYPEGQRLHLVEYDTIQDNVLQPLNMRLPKKPDENATVANTYIQRVSGSDTASELLPVFPQQNLAIDVAIKRGEHAVDIANDAATPSNTAILLLPLVLNLIPVALIADVNTFGMIVYTLLTDVLTVVPLMVKGAELIIVSKQKTYASVLRITGANLRRTEKEGKAAELWVARCVPFRSFRGIGEALLVVALVCMVGGVLAELVAMRWIAAKRQRLNDTLSLPTMMEDASRSKHE